MFDQTTANEIFARAYERAARECGNTDMVEVARMLEALRKRLYDKELSIYEALKQQWHTGNTPLEEALSFIVCELKANLLGAYGQTKVASVNEAFRRHPQEGEAALFQAFAEGLANWEHEIYDRLAFADFENVSPVAVQQQTQWKRLRNLILQLRWVECLSEFKSFATAENLRPEIRAHFYVIIGQVYLYYLSLEKEAQSFFDLAGELAPALVEVPRAYGEILLRNRKFEEARKCFLKALSLNEHDAYNYFMLGDSYREEGNLEAAENWYTDAHECDPLDLDYYSRLISIYGHQSRIKEWGEKIPMLVEKVQRSECATPNTKSNSFYNILRDAGVVFQNNAQYAKAEEYFKQAQLLEPDWVSAYFDLGYLSSLQKKYDHAEELFNKAILLAPECFDGPWALATLYSERQQTGKAIAAYEQCLAMRPEWHDSIHNAIGVLYDTQNQYKEAISHFRLALEKSPENVLFMENLANALQKAGAIPEATAAFERLLALDNNNPDRYALVAKLYTGIGNYEKAIALYQQAIDLNPGNLIGYENLIQAWKESGASFDEEKIRKRALTQNSANHDAYNKLAIFYHTHQQPALAEDYYRQALKFSPTDEVIHSNLATLLIDSGNLSGALEIYRHLTGLYPKNAIYWNRTALCSYRLGDYEKALQYLLKALELDNTNATYQDNAGLAYAQLNDLNNAEKHFRKALECASSADAHFYWERLGWLEYEKRRYTEALHNFEKGFQLQPDNSVYASNIALARMQIGDHAGALEYVRIARKLDPSNAHYREELLTIADTNTDQQVKEAFKRDLNEAMPA